MSGTATGTMSGFSPDLAEVAFARRKNHAEGDEEENDPARDAEGRGTQSESRENRVPGEQKDHENGEGDEALPQDQLLALALRQVAEERIDRDEVAKGIDDQQEQGRRREEGHRFHPGSFDAKPLPVERGPAPGYGSNTIPQPIASVRGTATGFPARIAARASRRSWFLISRWRFVGPR
jgi:hypothetical protein